MSQQLRQPVRQEWRRFLDTVTEELEGEPVTIEVVTAELGSRIEAYRLPLSLVNYDEKDEEVVGEPDGQGGTLPPPVFTSQKWEVNLRAFYAPSEEAPALPDLRELFRQPFANLWSDEARSVPLTKVTLRFGQELVARTSRTLPGPPPEAVPLPALLITPAT